MKYHADEKTYYFDCEFPESYPYLISSLERLGYRKASREKSAVFVSHVHNLRKRCVEEALSREQTIIAVSEENINRTLDVWGVALSKLQTAAPLTRRGGTVKMYSALSRAFPFRAKQRSDKSVGLLKSLVEKYRDDPRFIFVLTNSGVRGSQVYYLSFASINFNLELRRLNFAPLEAQEWEERGDACLVTSHFRCGFEKLEVARRVERTLGLKFSTFGKCWGNQAQLPARYQEVWRFMRKFKFVIAGENSSAEGYLTEKAFFAFAAQAIPIYFGDPTALNTLNPKRLVAVEHPSMLSKEHFEFIMHARSDWSFYRSVIEEPWFRSPAARDTFIGQYEALETFLKEKLKSA